MLLAAQLVRPVDWVAVLRTLGLRGIRRFVTIGPGRVLRGLVRKAFGSAATVLSTDTRADLDTTIRSLES